MGCTLVIDTSYGSTVGVVGYQPIVETDSRTHVERLQVNIARAVSEAGFTPNDIDTVIVGLGPAPFTGLRAGIVAAKAIAFATGAKLIGRNILEPQVQWNLIRRGKAGTLGDPTTLHVLTLAVNDARRKQLYFELCSSPLIGCADDGCTEAHESETTESTEATESAESTTVKSDVACATASNTPDSCKHDEHVNARLALSPSVLASAAVASSVASNDIATPVSATPLITMDIDYPASIVERVNEAVRAYREQVSGDVVVDVIGHGAARYADILSSIECVGDIVDESVLDGGVQGLSVFGTDAYLAYNCAPETPIEPLYLRRPDAQIPAPLKHVLGHEGAERKD